MKQLIFILTAILLGFTASAQSQPTQYSQSGGGIWFEVRSDTLNPCRYTEDNKIYQADREFTFEFHYFDPQGKERYMRYERVPHQGYELTENGDTSYYTYYRPGFSFSDVFDASDSCINRYLLKVACKGEGFPKDYNQTVEEFTFSWMGRHQDCPWKCLALWKTNGIYGCIPTDLACSASSNSIHFRISNTLSKKVKLGDGGSPSAVSGATSVGRLG